MEIRPVGTVLIRADGRTDRWTNIWTDGHDEANRRLSQLCERAWN